MKQGDGIKLCISCNEVVNIIYFLNFSHMMWILWFENVGYGMIHVQLTASWYNLNLKKESRIYLLIYALFLQVVA